MKRNHFVLGSVILAFSMAVAGAQPVVRLTVNNYDGVGKAINRIAGAVNPRSQTDASQQFLTRMGITNLASFDSKRPWEVALWYGSGAAKPLVAVKGPIKNIAGFKASLSGEGVLFKEGKDWIQLDKGQGAIIFTPSNLLSEAEASALTQWKGEAIQPSKKTLELNAHLTEPLRTQIKGMLMIGRASLSQMGSNPALAAPGTNPKAVSEMFSAYLDLLDTFVDGFNDLKLGLEVTPNSIVIDKVITAKPNSELARWIQPPAHSLTAADLAGLDPGAMFAGAGYLGKNESLVKLFQKFTLIGLQMQAAQTNDVFGKDCAALIEKTLPMKFSGSASFKNQISFCGAYSFPEGDAREAYAQVKHLFNESFQTQVGPGKMYSAATLVENHHKVGGVSVDRVALTMNLENPMFKAPGAKEQIEAFYPNGKMEMDYALKDGKLLLATVSGHQMQDLLEGKIGHKPSVEPEKGTCAAGYFNLLLGIQQMAQKFPMIPEVVKGKLAKLDSQQTVIEFQVSLDNQMHSTTRVPMKLLQEFGRLNDKQ